VARLDKLFGRAARVLSVLFWATVVLAATSAIFPLLFIIFFGIFGGQIAGISEVIRIWVDSRHLNAVINSLFLAVGTSLLLVALSTAVALVFRWARLTGHRLIYALSVVPFLIPDYVFGVLGRAVLDPSTGLLSGWVSSSLLINRYSALGTVLVVSIVKWLPVMVVVADSSLLGLGRDYLNQIEMDFSKFRSAAATVYLPEMSTTLLVIAGFGFLVGFRQHELAYELTSGGRGFSAETWSHWNYRVLFSFANIGHAATEALFALIVMLIPILLIRRQAQLLTHDEI